MLPRARLLAHFGRWLTLICNDASRVDFRGVITNHRGEMIAGQLAQGTVRIETLVVARDLTTLRMPVNPEIIADGDVGYVVLFAHPVHVRGNLVGYSIDAKGA